MSISSQVHALLGLLTSESDVESSAALPGGHLQLHRPEDVVIGERAEVDTTPASSFAQQKSFFNRPISYSKIRLLV